MQSADSENRTQAQASVVQLTALWNSVNQCNTSEAGLRQTLEPCITTELIVLGFEMSPFCLETTYVSALKADMVKNRKTKKDRKNTLPCSSVDSELLGFDYPPQPALRHFNYSSSPQH
jgi:hypothetical protein